MRVGLFTDALGDRELAPTLDWLERHAPSIRDLELGTGGYSAAPHCDLGGLLASATAREAWLGSIMSRGFGLAALNVSGNPLHPDPGRAARDDQALRETLQLAAALGVSRVVAMSGCPGEGSTPIFSGGGWLPDIVDIAARQWEEAVMPYWQDLVAYASREAPGVAICLELHPGTFVYNAETFSWIAELGDNIRVNLDPSHFFWQSIDPVEVARLFGPRIGHAHGKDTRFNPEKRALNGVLDNRWPGDPSEMPWTFATVGRGHDRDWWSAFVGALTSSGCNVDVICIEVEDPFVTAEASILESASALADALQAAGASDSVG